MILPIKLLAAGAALCVAYGVKVCDHDALSRLSMVCANGWCGFSQSSIPSQGAATDAEARADCERIGRVPLKVAYYQMFDGRWGTMTLCRKTNDLIS